jgi:5'-nucleotidase
MFDTLLIAATDRHWRRFDFLVDLLTSLFVLSRFCLDIGVPDGSTVVGQTAYSLLSDSKVISDTCKQKMKDFHAKYFPLEFDPAIGFDEKYKLMDEWWAASNGALIEEKATMDLINQSVLEAKLSLRPGFATAVQMAHQYDIPVIVFSAGITQIIEEVLRKLGPTDLMFPNVHVVANDLITDSNNVVVAFKEPLMHSLNKKDTSVAMVSTNQFEWFAPLRRRTNVLLLGDNLGDANMSDGYDHTESCVIKVGFLNANEQGLLEAYSRAFDIVVLNDGPMVPVANFLKEVIGNLAPLHATSVVPE